MNIDNRTPKYAVLIDAENNSHTIAKALFEEIAKFGDASIRRIYGDFTKPQISGWTKVLADFGIVPQQNFAITTGKNASDIALVIDGMDILHDARVDGFCLVTSDSDFTRLASRIREQGLTVYGFGEQKTPESLRKACHRFFYTETLAGDGDGDGESKKALLPPSKAIPLLKRAVEATADEDGWAHLGEVGSLLVKESSDFDSRNYGFPRLSALVQKTGFFDSRTDGKTVSIRIKKQAKPKAG
jgi:uncharacterized LabA/DUF88 family protein